MTVDDNTIDEELDWKDLDGVEYGCAERPECGGCRAYVNLQIYKSSESGAEKRRYTTYPCSNS